MKAYAPLILLFLLLIAGCRSNTNNDDMQTSNNDSANVSNTETKDVVEETLGIESIEDDFSLDDDQNDWGDII